MSAKKKRRLLQRNRTDQILEAAEKLFAQKGFYSTTVGEIAEKAGIAKGTIYLYFRDKRDLFFSVLESKLDILLEKVEKGIQKSKTVSSRIKEAIGIHLKFLEENEDFFKIMQSFPEEFKRKLGERLKGGLIERQSYYVEIMDKLIQEGIEVGEIRPFDSRKLAVILMGMLHSLTVYWISRKERTSLSEDKHLIYEVFWEGVKRESP